MNPNAPELINDAILLQLIEKNDKVAFNILFERYWENAFSDAYKRLKKYDNAKDIVQEIFIHIWTHRETLHIQNLPAYLHTAIRNQVIKYVAKQKHFHPFFDILENIPAKNAQSDGDLIWKEFFKSYETLMESLPPKRKVIFRLRYEENLPTKVISMQLGITKKTVQNQLGKALETLKVSLLRG